MHRLLGVKLAFELLNPYICCLPRQHVLPTVKIIDSIKIDIYSREHPPPHFHAIYAEYEELIEIETLSSYVGKLPKAQRNKVIEWAKTKQDYLMGNFQRLNPRL